MKSVAAVIGGAALVTMGALAVTIDSGPPPAHVNASSVGATVTATTPPTEPAIEMAVPSITGPAPLFAGEAPDANPQ
jgi:hypothetical protein